MAINLDFNRWDSNPAPPVAPAAAPAPKPIILGEHDPFDLAPAKLSLAAYDGQLDELVTRAAAVKITTEETNTTAVEMATQANNLAKKLEAARKAIVEKPTKFSSAVNAMVKPYTVKLEKVVSDLKAEMKRYRAYQELEQAKAAQAAEALRVEEQKKIDAEAAAFGVEAPQVEAVAVAAPPKVVHTSCGSAGTRKEWTFEITDVALVPREFMLVDEKAIRAQVKAGIRQIPGVRIFEDSNIVLR